MAPTHIYWVSDAIQPSHPLLSPSPPVLNISQNQGIFQWINSSHRWPKYWSFNFSISPSNEYSGLISFRTGWFYLLAVQQTLKNLLQHHSSKASILRSSAFFMVQLSHPYMTARKTIAFTINQFIYNLTNLKSSILEPSFLNYFYSSFGRKIWAKISLIC